MTTHDIPALYARYQSGQSLRIIGEDTGLAITTLHYLFHKMGYQLRDYRETTQARYPNQEETARMYADYQAGMTCDEVGEKYGYAQPVVWRRFQRHGLRTRKRGER